MSTAVSSSVPNPNNTQKTSQTSSEAVVRELVANELIFAVVGPVGSGTSEIAASLEGLLIGGGYQSKILKASDEIMAWAKETNKELPNEPKLALTEALQDAGDELRESTTDNAAVAVRLVRAIRDERARQLGKDANEGEPVEPDGKKRAFILDSIRHPHEVALLRRIYQDAFCLIAVVCDEDERYRRLHEEKYRDAGADALTKFMRRDENAPEKHGQKVADAFHLADFFVDNSVNRFISMPGGKKEENTDWDVPDQLGRLVDILTHARIVRPRPSETGMFHANGARMRSSCLSRQVGAAIMDGNGNVVSTGANEVPSAGGGVYGGGFANGTDRDPDPDYDFRCFMHLKFCSNTREQNAIIKELLTEIEEFNEVEASEDIIRRIRSTRIGQLIEFSRAVHAEMEAILSSGRQGISTKGTRIFVTTFPCHSCTRHIVAAGVDEVQFIEPYLKSKALSLHDDAITVERKGWIAPSEHYENKKSKKNESNNEKKPDPPKVLFRPFTGVAPRLYHRTFYKNRDLKDSQTGEMRTEFGPPEGFATWETLRVSYAQVEARLAEAAEKDKA